MHIDTFLARWRNVGGSERANYQLFIADLCAFLEVAPPQPADEDTRDNPYVFERRIVFHHGDGSTSNGFIDCYKRGSFIGEAKKIRAGAATRQFDDALMRARGQAENYARHLPADEGRPPFLMVIDVGNVIELYAEFTCTGGSYTPFPDPRSHRIKLDDLARDDIRARLKAVWEDPHSLDPARRTARATRDIAVRLARVAKSLEGQYTAERVANFLSRCLFSMFAEDVGLLPKINGDGAFTALLKSFLLPSPAGRGAGGEGGGAGDAASQFVPLAAELWKAVDEGRFSIAIRARLPRFNGKLFKNPEVLPVDRNQIELLLEAARADWAEVEPAIFGSLLENALDPLERHDLGAHYTPRAYVDRLVLPTVIEPLRAGWRDTQAAALLLANEGKLGQAAGLVRAWHHKLCTTRVLDPACGSGNFLYVTLEHMKRLEGEVLDTLAQLGDTQQRLEVEGLTVDPHQFLGLEINPRAAAIAEMVLWIGYLQWHFRTQGSGLPPSPILRDFHNIECRDAVLACDAVEFATDGAGQPLTRWDGRTTKPHPVTGEKVPDETARIPLERYRNPRPADWPVADYIVGNPPFIGAASMRQALGDGYTEALRAAWPEVPDSADFVMFWWHHAAALVRRGKARRFGFITTNSLRQTFNRRVLEFHLNPPSPPTPLPEGERRQASLSPPSPRPAGRGAGGEGPTASAEKMKRYARELRANQTDAETLMWHLLRNRQVVEAKFRRQHPMAGYLLDFYCPAAHLAIELDGSQHLEQAAYDQERAAKLEAEGVKTLRFWNNEVLQETESVLEAIYQGLEEALRPSPPAPLPAPRGEGSRSPDCLSASQPAQRGEGSKPLFIAWAIPDHPWVDAASGANVRIAMTVGTALPSSHAVGRGAGGEGHGLLQTVVAEGGAESDAVHVEFSAKTGRIHADLTIGADVVGARALRANEKLSHEGIKPHGMGFIVTSEEAERLQPCDCIRPYRNGRDLTDTPRGVSIIDFYSLSADEVRSRYPAAYQWILEHVKPERDQNNRAIYRDNWWLFGEARKDFRAAIANQCRYIATVKTAKHSVFQFLDASILPDSKLIAIALSGAYELGVLSSSAHTAWSHAAGSRLGVGNDPTYVKSACFEKFPFPAASPEQQTRIAQLAEHLDAHRKRQQAAHPDLTLTGMYNVLAKLRSGETLTARDKAIHETGLVAILRQLHDELDAAVLAAYGWSDLLPSPTGRGAGGEGGLADALLDRLVALNLERAAEEAAGRIRWLRPDFQNPSAAVDPQKQAKMDLPEKPPSTATAPAEKRPWPATLPEQVRAIADQLSPHPQDESALAARFAGKGPWKKRLPEILAMLEALGRAKQSEGGWVG
jgi:very-short-patch-repair endonuclease